LIDGGERIVVRCQPNPVKVKTYLKNNPGMVVHSCKPSHVGGKGRKIEVALRLAQGKSNTVKKIKLNGQVEWLK
jgi:hypothetical protein